MDGKKLKQFQKNLKTSQTLAEMKLWHYLRNRSFMCFKFRRQQIIRNYIVNFVCHEKNLIIELDGSQHQDQKVYDHMRTQELILLPLIRPLATFSLTGRRVASKY